MQRARAAGAVRSVERSFVGRSEELGLLDAALARARRGSPMLAWIEGPAGIGKTALVRSFLSGAYDCVVLWAATSPHDPAQPWETLRQLMAGTPESMRHPARRVRAALDSASGGVGEPLAELFQGLPGASDVLVAVLDNVQWADSASSCALRSAFRQLSSARLLLVTTARPKSQEAWDSLLEADDHALRISLSGLSPEELAELGAWRACPLSAAAARRLGEHSSGNPSHASALIEELSAEQLCRGWGPLPAPRAVTASVDSLLRRCSTASQALVEAVAVLGSPAPIDVAAALAGIGDPSAALQEAIYADDGRTGLLEELVGARHREVAFGDPMLEVAVYA